MFLTHPSGPRDSKLNPPAPGGRLEGPMVGWPISTWKLTVHIRWLWRETNKMCISCNMYIIVYVYGIEIIYLQEINTICCAIKVCQKRPLRHIISTKWSTRNLNCGTKPLYDFIYLYSQGSKSRSWWIWFFIVSDFRAYAVNANHFCYYVSGRTQSRIKSAMQYAADIGKRKPQKKKKNML